MSAPLGRLVNWRVRDGRNGDEAKLDARAGFARRREVSSDAPCKFPAGGSCSLRRRPTVLHVSYPSRAVRVRVCGVTRPGSPGRRRPSTRHDGRPNLSPQTRRTPAHGPAILRQRARRMGRRTGRTGQNLDTREGWMSPGVGTRGRPGRRTRTKHRAQHAHRRTRI